MAVDDLYFRQRRELKMREFNAHERKKPSAFRSTGLMYMEVRMS